MSFLDIFKVHKFKEQINTLQQQNNDLQQSYTTLQQQNNDLHQSCNTLQQQNDDLHHQLFCCLFIAHPFINSRTMTSTNLATLFNSSMMTSCKPTMSLAENWTHSVLMIILLYRNKSNS